MWFSKVPGYIFDKQKTPYLTEAKDLTLAQSQYELAAYGVFVGTIYGIIGLAAILSILESNNLIYYFWLFASVSVIYSIFSVIRKYEINSILLNCFCSISNSRVMFLRCSYKKFFFINNDYFCLFIPSLT